MSRMRIPAVLRRRVSAEFQNNCAYCHVATVITGAIGNRSYSPSGVWWGNRLGKSVRGLSLL